MENCRAAKSDEKTCETCASCARPLIPKEPGICMSKKGLVDVPMNFTCNHHQPRVLAKLNA